MDSAGLVETARRNTTREAHVGDLPGKPAGIRVDHDTSGPTSSEASATVKANLVFEITRVLSASLTASASGKHDTSGLARLARWKAMGISLENDAAVPLAESVRKSNLMHSRNRYRPLELLEPNLKFITAGISASHPVKQGSMLIVAFRGKMYLQSFCGSLVQVVYIKGGGKKPSHNYCENCFDIGQLSRVAVLLHTAMAEGGWLSPVVSTSDGRIMGSTYLCLRSEHIIVSLDAVVSPSAAHKKLEVNHNQWILEASQPLLECYACVRRMESQVLSIADQVLKDARRRGKRAATDEGENEGDGDDVQPW